MHQMCNPFTSAGFTSLFIQYLTQAVLFCFNLSGLRQAMWVYSTPIENRKGSFMAYFTPLQQMPDLLMMSLTQTVGRKMAAFLVAVLWLSNASFYQTGWEIKWKTKSVSYLRWSLCTLYITRMPSFFDWLMIGYRALFSTLKQTYCACM